MHSTMLNVVNNSQNTHDICNISHCKDIYFRYRKVKWNSALQQLLRN